MLPRRSGPLSINGIPFLMVAGLAAVAVAAWSPPAYGYIGPGAGFAVLGSFAVIFVTMVLAGVSILAWPFRTLWRMIRHRRKSKPLVKRVIFVGFAAEGTLARQIVDGAKTVRLFGDNVPVRAKVHTINGFSAHAGRRDLIDWRERVGPCM